MTGLLSEMHTKEASELVMDLVVNHTSDEHNGSWKAANQKTIHIVIIISGKILKDGKEPNNWGEHSEVLHGNLIRRNRDVLSASASPKNSRI